MSALDRVREMRSIIEATANYEPYAVVCGERICVLCDHPSDEDLEEFHQHADHCPYRRANEFINPNKEN